MATSVKSPQITTHRSLHPPESRCPGWSGQLSPPPSRPDPKGGQRWGRWASRPAGPAPPHPPVATRVAEQKEPNDRSVPPRAQEPVLSPENSF